ncbi:MAG: D-glycero-beta-D-manno-heptose 1-phosphate adenylyltransferase, partial [Candidatus Methylomirabilis sp.]|nr:D-glycero-beta-D-manno-heptose 1-phosphate adenylyltransferase [Candidatus Methylomirabilis sp.]
VVIFEEPDPSRIIEALEPDVLVKGADWAKEEVIGRETVERHGGRVVTIPLVEGSSTSNILRRIMTMARLQEQ